MPEALAALQRRFYELVAQPDDVEQAARRRAERDPGAWPLERWIVAPGPVEASRRLGLYADMYFARLHDALQETFPRTAELLGAAAFRKLAAEFLVASPPREASLRRLGLPLVPFLRDRPGLATRPDVADLALLELERAEAFDAADDPPLGLLALDRLATTSGAAFGEVRLSAARATRLVRLEARADEVWLALETGEVPPPPERERRTVLVWRRALVVHHRVVLGDELTALEHLLDGAAVADLCACFLKEGGSLEEAAAAALSALRQWAVDEVLAAPA